MARRVEHRDHVTVDVDSVGHVHLATKRVPHAFREHRLAVARRAIKKDRLTRVHRGTELLQHLVGDHEVRERGLQPFAVK